MNLSVSLSLCVRVSLSLCQHTYVRNHTSKLYQIFCMLLVDVARSSLAAASRYIVYFRFVDDVIFSHSGPDGASCVRL